MRHLLRRLAWLTARLFLVMVLSFLVLASATSQPRQSAPNVATDRLEEIQLPLLFNAHPRDIEVRVSEVIRRFQGDDAAIDDKELVRLGGASLPFIMPRLRQLPANVRERLALALLPVAQRANWRGANDVRAASQAYEFLSETWDERSADFQSNLVERWVARLATRGSATLVTTVSEYDTYALPFLLAALPEADSIANIERARRLLHVARRITGLPWAISNRADREDAQIVVDRWRRWWRLHALDYTSARGPARWSATLTQTGFGQWTILAFRHRFGLTRDGRPISRDLFNAGAHTLLLLVAGTVGTILVALWKRRLLRRRAIQARLPELTYLFASVPPIAAVALLSTAKFAHGELPAAIATCTAMALVDLGSLDRIDLHSSHPSRASGTSRRAKYLPSWLFAGHTWPYLLTVVFVIEKAFDVVGLGHACSSAFRARDLHMLMAVTCVTALWLLALEFVVQFRYTRSTAGQNLRGKG